MELLRARWAEGKMVCVGLDSQLDKIPEAAQERDDEDTVRRFNYNIIEETKDLVCAYKPNWAFYLEHHWGLQVLEDTIMRINELAPHVPVILDAKVGDIGNTNVGYVRTLFDRLGVDAVTIHSYLGQEANKPFLDRKDKGVIVLCKTSNPGSDEFQDQGVMIPEEKEVGGETRQMRVNNPLYRLVARNVIERWNTNGNCALVVGATYPEQLAQVRALSDYIPLLIPGIGAQGGDLEATVKAGRSKDGTGMIINSSRGIIFASNGDDYAEAARAATIELDQNIRRYASGD